eukprot:TRINITY_DN13527_c0_g1_i1.p1 TRINITY_DN13527_c0_g1~~TRINITY_DN13527_c0_g1_i1.p1  ORF type:complete len:460 (-),score=70.14 TRINITY_DN13527_c0_g1_i1:189-1568(-)
MGAPPIHHIPIRVNDSLSQEIARVEKGVMSNIPNENPLKVSFEEQEVNGACNPTFFGTPLSASSVSRPNRWNPFARKSGIFGVIHAQSKRNRVVSKHGKLNTFRRPEENEEKHSLSGLSVILQKMNIDSRYLKDFFTSMIGAPWSWTILSFAASFFFSWLVFAVIWYLVVLLHGDLSPTRPDDHVYCVDNIKDFTSCFLFSLETQHTIGYGVRATTEECPVAVLVMSLQSIVGVVIQACMAGIVFAKFTKPTMRAETILFSKNALISLRNGSYYLVCRIGDLRPTHLLESHVSGQMVKKEITEEGEVIPYHLESMDFGTEIDGTQDFFQMFWPIIVSHKIDEESPLFEMSARDISSKKQFEIILTMEGITPETGNTIQVRTSYLPNEILWGYRFEHSCVSYDKTQAKYAVSITNLNKVIADNTPRCSPKEWADRISKAASNLSVSLKSESSEANEESES